MIILEHGQTLWSHLIGKEMGHLERPTAMLKITQLITGN